MRRPLPDTLRFNYCLEQVVFHVGHQRFNGWLPKVVVCLELMGSSRQSQHPSAVETAKTPALLT